jgi:hypothetical protein
VGNKLKHLGAKPLAELHHALLMTGWTKVAALTRKGEQVFVAAFLAPHPCKTKMQIAAIQIPIDDIGHIGPPEAITGCIAVLPTHFQLFKVVFYAAVIIGPFERDL